MRKLRELTTRFSLADLVEGIAKAYKEDEIQASTVHDGATSPEARPEGERKFVKLHKTEKGPIRTGTRPDVFTAANIKKDTSRAGRDPLPGFPPDKWEVKEDLDEQGTHALEKGENPWKVWKGLGKDKPSWGEFKGLQSKETIGAKSSRRLPVGHEVKLPGGGSPKAPEFQKTEAPSPVKAQTPDTHGAAGAPQPSQSPKAPQWSPTAKPFNMTPVTPELKAKQIQSPINKEPMSRVPGTTAPPSAMDRVRAVTGRATPSAASGSGTPSSTQAIAQGAPTPSGPSASGSVNLRNTAKVAGAVGQAMTGGGVAVGQAIGKNFPAVGQTITGAAKSLIPGQGVSVGQRLGQKFRNWLGKEETEQLMEHRAAIMGSLIRGLEPELDEAAGVAKLVSKKVDPLIKRPKFDARGNLVLTQAAKQNITQGKKSRKLTGKTYKPSEQKRFGESKEQLDEKNWFHSVGASTPNDEAREKVRRQADAAKRSGKTAASARRRAEISRKHPELSEGNTPADQGIKAAKRDDEERKKSTVLVSPKGYKGGGKVQRIPKSQYDPKKHSLAEEQLDEKNWIQGAIKKPGALTASAKRAGKSVGEFAREHKHSSGKVGKRARLALTLKGLNKEEAEQIDELKKATLVSYIKGAKDKLADTAWQTGEAYAQGRRGAMKDWSKSSEKSEKGIERAADRLGGTYEVGKPRKVMIPGKRDSDPASGPYIMKKRKLYHAEETQLDEEADLRRAPRKLAPQEWRIGCMSDDEKKSVQLIEEGKELYEGGPTKKHFQMAADAIKAIPNEDERKKHAYQHAELYSKQNPRFNREKFYQAAGLKKHQYGPNEETELDEVITKSTPVGDVIHDFVHSDNKVFKGDSKKQRIKRALGAYYGKQRGE